MDGTIVIRVLLVDDTPDVLCAMRQVLARAGDILVVGALESADSLVARTAELLPDVVVVDLGMPGLPPLDAVTQVAARHPEVRIVVYSGHDAPEDVEAALDSGADRFVSKFGSLAEIVASVRDVATGHLSVRQ